MFDMYMNGRNIHEKTRELNDAAWDSVGPAFLGGAVFAVSLVMIGGRLLYRHVLVNHHDTISAWAAHDWIGLCIIAGSFWFACHFWLKRSTAISAVNRHCKAMKTETEKRGCGWADS